VRRHRIDPRLAKSHRTYTVEEVARLFGVHRHTVRTWLKAGLLAIDDRRPILILGLELRRFLESRRAARKRPTPPGMIYCLRCREPRPPAGGIADYQPRSAGAGDLIGICPVCEAMLYRRVNFAKLGAVRGPLEVRVTQADSRISDCTSPSLNHDFHTPGTADANAQP
jgi:excisionase family DNA binding protein